MRYFILYKPYGVLSQFTREAPQHRTLGDVFPFPEGVYPVGRLDKDSEGLLLLTDDKKLNHQLLDPKFQHTRTYWAQVERIPTDTALQQLEKGVIIRINKKDYRTRPATAQLFTPPPLPERDPPIRYRETVPTAWIELTLTEGKNRQVRRMCAAVGFPVLRLIRFQIEKLQLPELQIGEVWELSREEVYGLLKK